MWWRQLKLRFQLQAAKRQYQQICHIQADQNQVLCVFAIISNKPMYDFTDQPDSLFLEEKKSSSQELFQCAHVYFLNLLALVLNLLKPQQWTICFIFSTALQDISLSNIKGNYFAKKNKLRNECWSDNDLNSGVSYHWNFNCNEMKIPM